MLKPKVFLVVLSLVGFSFSFIPRSFPQPPLYGYRARPLKSPKRKTPLMAPPQEWENRFFLLRTELFPGVLLHSPYPEIRLFSHPASWGLGAPTYCIIPTKRGTQVLRRGYTFNGVQQSEAWLLVWFAHSENWTFWDAPLLVVLQHRPYAIHLSQEGLSLSFPQKAGDIVLIPLYGYYKPPQKGKDFLAEHGLPSRGIRPWEWVRGLPQGVLPRCQTLTQISRAFPLYNQETFALEGDTLLLKSRFTWRKIKDDWNTPAKRFAPLPPTLGIAWWAGKNKYAQKPFPMNISQRIWDPDIPTPYGPWLGVENSDSYEIRFPLLTYLHQAEEPQPPSLKTHPSVKKALDWVQQRMAQKFATTDWNQIWDHGGPHNYCWQVMGDRWYAKILPYLSQEIRRQVFLALQGYLQSYVLKPEHYKPFRGVLLLVGPGIGTWGGYDDAGKFSSNLLETLWCYGHFTGDWQTIAQHWNLIKTFFITPLECDWKSFGRYAIAEMGDEASPPLAMARMAYRRGSSLTPYRLEEDTAHIAPSLIRLRSLLLNEPPEKLARLTPPDQWKLGRSADGIAFCWSFLRTSVKPRLVRLIPPQKRTAYVLGLEQATEGGPPLLVLAIETTVRGQPSFPVLRWWGWSPPQKAGGFPGADFWGFGQIVLPNLKPKAVRFQRLNWNTGVYVYEIE